MPCIEISPIIAVCVLCQLIVFSPIIGAFSSGVWIERNESKKSLQGIHQEILKGNLRATVFILFYPIVGLFFALIAYPIISTLIIISVALSTLWVKNVGCT